MSVKNKRSKSLIFTKELWGMFLTLVSVISLFCLITGDAVLYPFGAYVSGFFLGVFGYFAYPLAVFAAVFGVMTIIGKKPAGKNAAITAFSLALAFISTFFILHLALFSTADKTFGEYLSACYDRGATSPTMGGAVTGAILYGTSALLSEVGTFLLFSLVLIVSLTVTFRDKIFVKKETRTDRESAREENRGVQPVNDYSNAQAFGGERAETSEIRRKKRLVVVGDNTFSLSENENKRSDSGSYTGSYSEMVNDGYRADSDYKKREETVVYGDKNRDNDFNESASERYYDEDVSDDDFNEEVAIPKNYTDEVEKMGGNAADDFDGVDEDADDDAEDILVDSSDFGLDDEPKPARDDYFPSARKTDAIKPQEESDEVKRVEEKNENGNPFDEMPLNFKYSAPPTTLLKNYDRADNYGEVEMFKKLKAEAILNALKHLSGIETTIENIVHGPTVTRFDIRVPENVSMKAITKYVDDIKLRLQCKNDIRFAPVPGTSYLGLEVPNDKQSTVGLRSVIESEEFIGAGRDALAFAIGKDTIGNPVITDLTKMPHLLVAGATGTGKSVGLNSLLISLMYKYSPQDLRFIIVDPKQVEFSMFAGMPHMLFDEIIYDAPKTIAMLNWAIDEMESRYSLFREAQVKNIFEYNMQIDPRKERKLAKIVILIDEFADLMSTDKKNIESKIARLAAKARAAGFFMILATQRPSVNIIEGSIKTNFVSRIAFKMSNAIDSQTILNEMGAEKLLGKGDLLYKVCDMPVPERAQGAFIDTSEIKDVVNYIKSNNASYFNEKALRKINGEAEPGIEVVNGKDAQDGGKGKVGKDNLFALYLAIELGELSISLLQRKLHYGFSRAGALCDWLERKGYIVDLGTGKRKKVTITKEKFDELYGEDFSLEEYEAKIMSES